MQPTLVSIPYSPWSMRARMALDLQRVPHQLRLYTSMLSEPMLRWELGAWRGPIRAPLLLRDDGPALRDSFDIASWGAERSDEPLITAGNRAEVTRWNEVANSILEAGRVRTTLTTMNDPEALRELVPPPMDRIQPLAVVIGRYGARRLLSRYGLDVTEDELRQRMVAGLTQIRRALGGRETLLPTLSYADVTAASALAFVEPHAKAMLKPKSRAHWVDERLAAEWRDLVEWRDRLYARW